MPNTLEIDYDNLYGPGNAEKPPAGDTQAQATISGDPELMDYIVDMGKGVVGGARDAAQETINFGYDAVDAASNLIDENAIPDKKPDWMELPNIETETLAGEITRDVSQFVVGFVGAGKFLKAAKVLQGGARWTGLARGAAQGAMADGIAMTPSDERLSNLVEDHPWLQNPISEYLAAGPEDTEAEGRFKNTLEGLALGGLAEGLLHGLKAMKYGAKIAKNKLAPKEAEAALTSLDDLAEAPTRKVATLEDLEQTEKTTGVVIDPKRKAYAAEQQRIDAMPLVDTDGLRTKLLAPENVSLETKLGDFFNVEKLDTTEDGLKAMEIVVNELAPILKERTGNVQTFKETIQKGTKYLGEILEQSPETIASNLTHTADSMYELTARVYATKGLLDAMYSGMAVIAKRVNLHNTPLDKAHLVRRAQQLIEMTDNLKRIQTESARVTSAGRIPHAALLNTADKELIEHVLAQAGGSKAVSSWAKVVEACEGNPKGMMKILSKGWKAKAFDVTFEMYVNGLLTGAGTHVINLLNTMKMVGMPIEKMVGSVSLKGIDKTSLHEGYRQLFSLHRYVKDSMYLASRVLRTEVNILDPFHTMHDKTVHAIHPGNFNLPEGKLATTIDAIGQYVRMPSRFLGTTDEFFKQMNYRSHLYGELYVRGAEMGLKGDDLAIFIETSFVQQFDAAGAGLAENSLQYARRATYTQDLEYGLGRGLQITTNYCPPLKFVMPFIRTSTNLTRDIVDHTPVFTRWTDRWKGAKLEGGEQIALAKGAERLGGVTWAAAIFAAMNGLVTGGGPRGKQRENLMRSGWQPYSFKVGDKYISFKRADPWGAFFGLAADWVEVFPLLSEGEALEASQRLLTGLSRNIVSKTYLRGITGLLDALDKPEQFGDRFIKDFATSWIPMSAGNAMVRRGMDPYMREAWDMMDAFKDRLPGYSQSLPLHYDWLSGEPTTHGGAFSRTINPFAIWDAKQDLVYDELVNLGHGFSPPPKTITQGNGSVKLTPALYSEFCQLNGTLKRGRYNLHDALEREMKKPAYDLKRERFADAKDGLLSKRVTMLQRIMRTYRSMAQQELLNRHPELKTQLRSNRVENLRSRAGLAQRKTGNDLEKLLQLNN